jgi:hypothetical protein
MGQTVSFREDVKGWVSFKSFVPENAISCANDYFTIKNGKLYKHYDESKPRNTFYNVYVGSSVNVMLNDQPGSVKSFHTLGYEGSQSKIDVNTQDNEYYNLTDKPGWYVSNIETDKQVGSLNEFIEKEGKWFNYIKGVDYNIGSTTDFEAFNIQGLGKVVGGEIGSTAQPQQYYLEFKSINVSLQVGDIIYYSTTDINGPYTTIDTDNITKLGDVLAINGNIIIVRPIDMYSLETNTIPSPQLNDYFMFTKNQVVNTSSLVGYYADVRFENNSKEKAEIFSVNSEITESSK